MKLGWGSGRLRSRLAAAALTLLAALGLGLAAATPAAAFDRPPFQVRIVPGSTLHLVSGESLIPIQIQNRYDEPVRVQIHIEPSNLRVSIPSVVEIEVPAQTTSVAKVPVRAVADGDVELSAWITSFSGQRLGPAVTLQMSVSAEIEGVLIIGFGAIVVGLLAVGSVRMVRKRKAEAA